MKPGARVALLACVVAALPACGHQVYRAAAPDIQSGCVGGLAELASHPLTYLTPKEKARTRRLEFAEVAACVTLDGAAMPVALYRLDGLQGETEIDIRVSLSEGGTFAASAELLDAGFHPMKHHPFTAFVRRSNEYSLSVFIDRARPGAPAYLLLRPDPTQVGKDDRTITSQSTALYGPGGASIYFGKEVTRLRPLLAAGQLQVVPYPVQRAGFEANGNARE